MNPRADDSSVTPAGGAATAVDEQRLLRSTARELKRMHASFLEAQQALRETVFDAYSADSDVTLRVTGDGLATSVRIAPQLAAQGVEALERAVLEAVNDAAMTLQGLTTAHMQAAAVRAGIVPDEAAVRWAEAFSAAASDEPL